MHTVAYVILPFSDVAPADAITASLARFERGRRGEVPDAWLRFHDETADLREEHERLYTFTLTEGVRIEGGALWHVDTRKVREEMEARGRTTWHVRLADVEPDFDRFVARFALNHGRERHPVTSGHGRWLNGLGHWDYWELGGAFDGRITGRPATGKRRRARIGSGPSDVRDAIGSLSGALADALGHELPEEIEVETDDNIELISRLRDDLVAEQPYAVPGVLVLPPPTDDALRWLEAWPETGPPAAVKALTGGTDTRWRDIVHAAYRRYPDHWAAAVSFHF